jgi:hypothetical protein
VGALVFSGIPYVKRSAPGAVALQASTRITDDGQGLRTRNILVAAQVALTLTLLVGSVLMVQSFWRLTRVNPGFTRLPQKLLSL